jgi:D-xylose transport system substrate-binding protein
MQRHHKYATTATAAMALLAPMLLAGGTACAAGLEHKVAFLLPDAKTARYETLDKPYFTAALKKDCPDCQLMVLNATADASKQQQQAENAVTNGASVLVIIPVDAKASVGIVANAKASGVKVISYGRLISNAEIDAAVAFDAAMAGQEQATSLVEAIAAAGHPTGPIIAINGSAADPNVPPIKSGSHKVFQDKGVTIAAEYDTPDWSPDKAQTEMDQAITKVGADGFQGVYSMNDGMAAGIIAAMKNAGIDPKARPVTGLDADLGGVQRIIAGEQYMSVFQDIKSEAIGAAQLATDLINGRPLTPELVTRKVNNGKVEVPTYFFRIAPVTAKNVKAELFDTGYYTAAEACVGPYAAPCEKLGIK